MLQDIASSRRRSRDLNISNLHILLPHLNRYGIQTIVSVITPFWTQCIEYPKLFSKLFNIFIVFNSLGVFSILYKFIRVLLKLSLGISISSVGILWN
jgi:hypothetical protein